jgi:hypothetical protein
MKSTLDNTSDGTDPNGSTETTTEHRHVNGQPKQPQSHADGCAVSIIKELNNFVCELGFFDALQTTKTFMPFYWHLPPRAVTSQETEASHFPKARLIKCSSL